MHRAAASGAQSCGLRAPLTPSCPSRVARYSSTPLASPPSPSHRPRPWRLRPSRAPTRTRRGSSQPSPRTCCGRATRPRSSPSSRPTAASSYSSGASCTSRARARARAAAAAAVCMPSACPAHAQRMRSVCTAHVHAHCVRLIHCMQRPPPFTSPQLDAAVRVAHLAPPSSPTLLTSPPHLLTSSPPHLLTPSPPHLITSSPPHLITSSPHPPHPLHPPHPSSCHA